MTRRKNFFWRRWIVAGAVLLAALAGFVLSDAVLQRNTVRLTAGSERNGDFGQLVAWLPDTAKKAIEYRARYLFLQTRMNRTRHPDARVEAACVFADFIAAKDPAGADAIRVGLVTMPEFRNSRRAFPAYARLLLDAKSSHPVTLAEFHAYASSLAWPEDRLQTWYAVWGQLGRLRLDDRGFAELVRPLMTGELPPYRNYDRFYRDIAAIAAREDRPELATEAARRLTEVGKLPYVPGLLTKAPLEFRERYAELTELRRKADTPARRLDADVGIAALTRGVMRDESDALLLRAADDPAYAHLPNRFQLLAKLLLHGSHPRRISIAQYHAAIRGIAGEELRFQAWRAGWGQLEEQKADSRTRYEYLSPLADPEPKYQEYAELMRPLAKFAAELGDAERAGRAEKFLRRVQEIYVPSLFESDGPAGAEAPKE